MSKHHSKIELSRAGRAFDYDAYSRNHWWVFKGDERIEASAAAQFLGDPKKMDPEDAFVASLSSCHMLTFLAICSRKGLSVESYSDEAVGFLEKDEVGKLVITRVELHPKVCFSGDVEVSNDLLRELHERSHHECFLANSVKTEITTIIG